jgi:hypothetical protein
VHHSRHRRGLSDGQTDPADQVEQPSRTGPPRPARRILRLIAAIGAIVGGQCAVLALIALVVEMGAQPTASVASSTPRRPAISARHDRAKTPPPRLTVGRTVRPYSGGPMTSPARIQITFTGIYGITWSFRCPEGSTGSFTVRDGGGTGTGQAVVAAAGQSRQGVWWDLSQRGRHTLLVASDCPWSAQVVRPEGAPPQPTPTHSSTGTSKGSQSPSPTNPPTPKPTPTPIPSPAPRPTGPPQHTPPIRRSPPPSHTAAPGNTAGPGNTFSTRLAPSALLNYLV